MNDSSKDTFEKLEFWALTTVFVLCLMLLDGDLPETVRYVTVFLSLLYIDFRIVPALTNGTQVTKNIFLLLGIIVIFSVVYLATANFDLSWKTFGESMFLLLLISGHLAVKQAALFIVSKSESLQAFFIILNRNGLLAFGLWMIVTYWILIIGVPTEVRLVWLSFIPFGILLYGVSFEYFIPSSIKQKSPLLSYFLRVIILCFVLGFAASIIMVAVTDNEDRAFSVGAFDGVIHVVLTAPALWLIYRWQRKGKEQIHALQTQLGRSTANVDFLRSQINPHFLFNALNTIYGLAIQEKAERTSASVEKLGDMMRFMLSENIQERIQLSRELEYLDNYISLQKLRTDGNPHLTIEVDLPGDIEGTAKITPMLLIPFVENAFKHGISLQEPSHIKIFLELKGRTLYFDVHNSTHPKLSNDPEKNSNGIGLENVRLRLQHMYPGSHELLVRETSREFFVHLKIELE